jgi:uncharacterized protein (TIGR03032 family)
MFSLTDTREGWRNAAPGSGVIVDIASHDVICSGMTKPHSLRWHNGRLWALESATGEFGYVDGQTGRFVVITHIGNFVRGLVMIGDYALIGGTPVRGQPFKQDLSIPGFINSIGSLHSSGLYVVDLRTGAIVHALQMTGVNGVYDVVFVPDITQPLMPRFDGPDDDSKWTSFAPIAEPQPTLARAPHQSGCK